MTQLLQNISTVLRSASRLPLLIRPISSMAFWSLANATTKAAAAATAFLLELASSRLLLFVRHTDEVAVRTTTQAASGMIHLVTTAAILLAVTHLATTLAARKRLLPSRASINVNVASAAPASSTAAAAATATAAAASPAAGASSLYSISTHGPDGSRDLELGFLVPLPSGFNSGEFRLVGFIGSWCTPPLRGSQGRRGSFLIRGA